MKTLLLARMEQRSVHTESCSESAMRQTRGTSPTARGWGPVQCRSTACQGSMTSQRVCRAPRDAVDAEGALVTDLTLMEVGKAALPYRLTGSQERVLQQILEDMQAPLPMLRLLQATPPPPPPPPPPPSACFPIMRGLPPSKLVDAVAPVVQAVRKVTTVDFGVGLSAAEQSGTDVSCWETWKCCVSSVMRHAGRCRLWQDGGRLPCAAGHGGVWVPGRHDGPDRGGFLPCCHASAPTVHVSAHVGAVLFSSDLALW